MVVAELLAVALVVGVLAVALRRGRVVTPIPESVVTSLGKVASGSLLDTIWRVGIVGVLVLVVYVLFAMGGMAGIITGFIASIILSAIIEDDIRDIVRDLWNRNFWVFRT
jgi:hypothetical protein